MIRCLVIVNFKHKGLKLLHQKDDASKIRQDLLPRVKDILLLLDEASAPEALKLPGYGLHHLTGDLKGFWSVTVSRIIGLSFAFTTVMPMMLILLIITRRNPMPMKNPPHPGHCIKDACLEPLGLTITAGAKALGITRANLSRVINGRGAISPEMAIRLSKAFGSTPETWLRMQLAYDLAQLRNREDHIQVRSYRNHEGHPLPGM